MDGVALQPSLRIVEADGAPGTTRLLLSGEVDCASVRQLRARIRDALAAGTTTLVLDLAGVTFLDAAGLGVLIGALRQLSERGGRLELCRAPRPVQRVLEITGVTRLLRPTAEPGP